MTTKDELLSSVPAWASQQYGPEMANKIWHAHLTYLGLHPLQDGEPMTGTVPETLQVELKKVAVAPKKKKVARAKPLPKRTTLGTRAGPVTQKARGINALATLAGRAGYGVTGRVNIKELLPYTFPDFHARESFDAPFFARPCPRRPRHGFVDSRGVTDSKDLLLLFQEATAADPDAEVLVMSRLTGCFSGVATNSGVTFGMDHAGVTGKGDVIWHIPSPSKIPAHDGYCDIKESPYIEFVEHWGEAVMVQLRDGPPPPAALQDYVPRPDYRVEHVCDATPWFDDLIGWERHAATLPHRTAVLARGVALSSHVVVHCIIHGIAVITSDKPVAVGSVLQPESTTPVALTTTDHARIASLMCSLATWNYCTKNVEHKPSRAFKLDWPGLSLKTKNIVQDYYLQNQAIALSASVLHSMALWGNEPHLLRLRAFGAVTLAKFLVAACLGEARHFFRVGPGVYGKDSAVKWPELFQQYGLPCTKDNMRDHRNMVYEAALCMDLPSLLKTAEACARDFKGPWGRRPTNRDGDETAVERDRELTEGCSYGGKNWHIAATITAKFIRAIIAYIEEPTPERWELVAKYYNSALNTVHNGGYLLTKWIESSALDMAARAPCLGFISGVGMRIICSDMLPPLDMVRKARQGYNEYKKMPKRAMRRLLCFGDQFTTMPESIRSPRERTLIRHYPVEFIDLALHLRAYLSAYQLLKELDLWARRLDSNSGYYLDNYIAIVMEHE